MSSTRDTSNLTPQQIRALNDALFEQWDAQSAVMKAKTAEANLAANAKNIKPEDIGVSFGPVMDEETFKKYQARKNQRFTVMKADDLAKLFGKK
ncbi:hypothetical protein ATCVMN08101_445R [Acanthocystis turfacea Chlorella virus MN0810.1]|nr:hypothetical protein ATCVMN08101_445R [Acanthocystis turfacea Chlorella virus MN0810.1]